jgi:hypothetical protein
MGIDPQNSSVSDVRSAFAAEPGATREERVAWLRAELQKGLDSGIDPRPYKQIMADIMAKHGIDG